MFSGLAGIVALSLAMAPTWRPVGRAAYAPMFVDALDQGVGVLQPLVAEDTFLAQPGALLVEPGATRRLQLSVPASFPSPAVTMVLDGSGITSTVVTCEVGGVVAPIGHATRVPKLRVHLASCPPGDGPRSVSIAVTHEGIVTDGHAFALDAIEIGTTRRLPPVATWLSCAVLIASFALALFSLLGAGWPSVLGPVALGVVLGRGLALRGGALVPVPSPVGGLWDSALQAAVVLLALTFVVRRREPAVVRAVVVMAVAWLTAAGMVARWTYLDAMVGTTLWPDVGYVHAVLGHMKHPYDTGTREPFWIWAAWGAKHLFGSSTTAQRVASVLLSTAAIPAAYGFASAYGRSRLLGLLAAGALAGHAYLTGSAAEGHRTELLILQVLAVSYFAFVSPMARITRVAGLAGSTAALALTSLNGAVLIAALMLLNLVRRRISFRDALVVGAVCGALLAPHVIYNYKQFDTYSWFSARGVPTFYRNYEFMVVKGTGCDGCPTKAELAVSSYSGRPIGMGEYLFGLHTPSEVASRIADGFYRAFAKQGPELASLLGHESALRRWLFLAGSIIALLSPMRELLVVPLAALNLSAFVVPLGIDARLITQPVGVVMLIMVLPVFHAVRLAAKAFAGGGTAAAVSTEGASAAAVTGSAAQDEVVGDLAAADALPRHGHPGAVTVSVIVPVYNERHLVAASVAGVLAIQDPAIAALQVVIVDDRSTDTSWSIVERIAKTDARVIAVRHAVNGGKGAAVQTGLRYCRGDVTVIHDADLEYDPRDIPAVIRPIVFEGADAVFGSRYLSAGYRRALRFKHSLMNKFITLLSNWFTDLDLTDVETCYKAVRTPLLQSIPIRSRDFRLEIELAMKLAKRRARVFEVPIRYLPRTYREGKKIGPKDGLLALGALVHFSLVDDIYQNDAYGSQILNQLERTRRFNTWMGDTLRPHLGDRVLEIGSGIGTLTEQMIPRDAYTVSDINPVYLAYLRSYVAGKPYLDVRHIDASKAEDFVGLDARFDTVMMVNVLEHVLDEKATLGNVFRALEPGGRYVVLVPQHPGIYGTLDEALEHRERYTREGLKRSLEHAGFVVEKIFDFNRASVPGWWFNGRVLKRRTFSRFQLKVFDSLVPILRHVDHWLPYGGQSVIGIARRPRPDESTNSGGA